MKKKKVTEVILPPDKINALAETLLIPIPPPQYTEIDASLVRSIVSEVLDTLAPMEVSVIRAIFFDGCSRNQAAKKLEIPYFRVCRLEARALRKLRRPARVERLKVAWFSI